MSPLLVHFLRRVALFALILAVLAAVGPRVLRELGVIGPRPPEVIAAAERSIEAARHYGADDSMTALQEANRHLQEARALAEHGEGRRARHAAAAASQWAIVSQRQALARREQQRRQAEEITRQIDKLLNTLDELYAHTSPALSKGAAGDLLSRLKATRQIGAALILAFEQGNYARVIAEETVTRKALEAFREEMKAAGRPDSAPRARKRAEGPATP
jgi:hypothetical protein